MAFIGHPVSPVHLGGLLSREDIRRRLREAFTGLTRDAATGVHHGTPFTLLPFSKPLGGQSRWILRHWPRFTAPDLIAQLAQRGFGEVDLVLFDGPVHAGWTDRIRARRRVLRVFDRTDAFPGLSPTFAEQERELALQVDLVAYTARSLAPYVESFGAARRLFLPNGVDYRRFAIEPRPAEPSPLQSIPAPRAIYVGAMADWFDFDLVRRAAEALSGIQFVLIGPADLARRRLPTLPNLHLLGSVDRSEMPAYLANADVGLIPFDVERHPRLVDSINPLKLYEYLAAGLPVVARAWAELCSIASPAVLADSPDAFIAGIAGTLASPPPRKALQSFAAAHDWRIIAHRLLEVLDLPEPAPFPYRQPTIMSAPALSPGAP